MIFSRKVWFDKDGKDDPYYSLKFVQYEKEIGENAAIEICHCYKTEDGELYRPIETTFELRIGTEYIKINDIDSIPELYRIITGKQMLKNVKTLDK